MGNAVHCVTMLKAGRCYMHYTVGTIVVINNSIEV